MTEIFTPPVLLLLFSVGIAFLMNAPYRFLMNQQEAGAIKAKVKELQERSKYVQRQGNSMLASQLMREALVESSKLTSMTMKPMLVSLVAVLLILPLLGNMYADVIVEMKDGKGEAKLNGNTYSFEMSGNNVKISGGDIAAECTIPCRKRFDNWAWNIATEKEHIKLERIVALLPVPLPFFSDSVGWFGWYFIVAIPLMFISRKMLKINL